jgi:cell division protein FtsL
MRRPRLQPGTERLLRLAGLAALLAAVGIFHVWSRTQVIAAGYDLARLESEHRRLAAERDRLRIEVATLRAPGRLERFARERLGMAPPAPGAVVAVVKGGTVVAGGLGGGAGHRSPPAEPAVGSGAAAPVPTPGLRLALRGSGRAGRGGGAAAAP